MRALLFSIFLLSWAWAQPGNMLERWTRELNLTTTQVEQVRTLLQKHRPPERRDESSARPSYDATPGNGDRPKGPPPNKGAFEAELKKILNADQWAKFQELRSRRQQERKDKGGGPT